MAQEDFASLGCWFVVGIALVTFLTKLALSMEIRPTALSGAVSLSRMLWLLGLWAVASAVVFSTRWLPGKDYIDADEVYWIGSSYYYDLAFRQRDWASPHWALIPARENPPLAKYAIGAVLAMIGRPITKIDLMSHSMAQWIRKSPELGGLTEADRAKRDAVIAAGDPAGVEAIRASGRIPISPNMLTAVRRLMVGFAVLVSLMLLLFGTALGGPWAGLISSQLWLLHPHVIKDCFMAMSDPVALFFSTAAAGAGCLWYCRFAPASGGSGRVAASLSVLTGILTGLACSAKMNSAVVLLTMGVMVCVAAGQALLRSDRRAFGRALVHGLVILGCGLAVFILINPAILQDVPSGLAATVLEHRQTALIQGNALGGLVVSLPDKASLVAWMAYLGWPMAAVMGIAVIWGAVRHGHHPTWRFVLVWWLVTLVAVVVWLPFAWSRYMLPLLPPSLLILGGVSADLLGLARRRFAGRGRPPTGPVLAANKE